MTNPNAIELAKQSPGRSFIGFSHYLDRELLAGRMRAALNTAYCALTDDAACHLAYLAAGITRYDAEDHERAVTYARLWREQSSNIRRQLEAA